MFNYISWKFEINYVIHQPNHVQRYYCNIHFAFFPLLKDPSPPPTENSSLAPPSPSPPPPQSNKLPPPPILQAQPPSPPRRFPPPPDRIRCICPSPLKPPLPPVIKMKSVVANKENPFIGLKAIRK